MDTTLPKSESDAYQLENQYVYKIYDEIANHMHDVHQKPWAHVINFIRSFPSGSLLLDIGCGNGRYMNIRNDIIMIGCDRSEGLLNICRHRSYQVFLSDCTNISVPTNMFDGAICIAVLHHISTYNRRLMALKEIVRLLKPGGKAMVTVWAREQNMDNKTDTKTCPIHSKKSINDKLIIHSHENEFKQADCLVPWNKRNDKLLRYYHVFARNELEHILSHISRVRILNSFNDSGNWCIIFTKLV